MKIASQYFTDSEKKEIAEAVVKAEAKTSVEIVPVAATSSGRYDRAEDIIGVFFGIIAMLFVWGTVPRPEPSDVGSWGDAPFALFLVLSLVGGFIVGVAVGQRVGWLRKLFTPRSELTQEVREQAAKAFFDQRIHHTSRASRLLIYISFFERQAVILGDETVEKDLGKDAIETLCMKLTEALANKVSPAAAMISVIEDAGERLSEGLPQLDGEENELDDALVCLD